MEAVSLIPISIQVVQNLIEKNQYRAASFIHDAADRLGQEPVGGCFHDLKSREVLVG